MHTIKLRLLRQYNNADTVDMILYNADCRTSIIMSRYVLISSFWKAIEYFFLSQGSSRICVAAYFHSPGSLPEQETAQTPGQRCWYMVGNSG